MAIYLLFCDFFFASAIQYVAHEMKIEYWALVEFIGFHLAFKSASFSLLSIDNACVVGADVTFVLVLVIRWAVSCALHANTHNIQACERCPTIVASLSLCICFQCHACALCATHAQRSYMATRAADAKPQLFRQSINVSFHICWIYFICRKSNNNN